MAWTRDEERELFGRVLEVVNEFDLMGLGPGERDGAPLDEYTAEAREIESVLINTGRIDFGDLSRIWRTWFDDDLTDREATVEPFLEALNALVPQNPS